MQQIDPTPREVELLRELERKVRDARRRQVRTFMLFDAIEIPDREAQAVLQGLDAERASYEVPAGATPVWPQALRESPFPDVHETFGPMCGHCHHLQRFHDGGPHGCACMMRECHCRVFVLPLAASLRVARMQAQR